MKMCSRHLLYCRYIVLFAILLVLKTIISSNDSLKKERISPKFSIAINPIEIDSSLSRCYRLPDIEKPIDYFKDILDATKQPVPGKTIFFLETTCSTTGVVSLNSK